MVDQQISSLLERVSELVGECQEAWGSENIEHLDSLGFRLRSGSAELGEAVLTLTTTSEYYDDVFKITELKQCISELANFIESRHMRLTQNGAVGRPKKFVNIAMVCVYECHN